MLIRIRSSFQYPYSFQEVVNLEIQVSVDLKNF